MKVANIHKKKRKMYYKNVIDLKKLVKKLVFLKDKEM